jgi:hypothetical protein
MFRTWSGLSGGGSRNCGNGRNGRNSSDRGSAMPACGVVPGILILQAKMGDDNPGLWQPEGSAGFRMCGAAVRDGQ